MHRKELGSEILNNKNTIISFILISSIFFTYLLFFQKSTSLRELAIKNNILIGTAVTAEPLLKETQYRDVIKKEFSLVTLENELKFARIHPEKNVYNFFPADFIVEFAKENDLRVRGHTLVWDQQLPNWLIEITSRDELKQILKNHIQTTMQHYKGEIYAWDVVNEAFNDDGTLKDNIWLRIIGPEYIELAFSWAHEADPQALLFYNDFHNEGLNAKSQAIYQMAKKFKQKGIPIDGIGFQLHTSVKESLNYKDISENFYRFSKIGMECQVTEMDVSLESADASTEENLEKQANIYKRMSEVCLSSQNCSAFVTWGFTDKYSWIQKYKPLLFDNKFRKKPAYRAVNEVFNQNYDR